MKYYRHNNLVCNGGCPVVAPAAVNQIVPVPCPYPIYIPAEPTIQGSIIGIADSAVFSDSTASGVLTSLVFTRATTSGGVTVRNNNTFVVPATGTYRLSYSATVTDNGGASLYWLVNGVPLSSPAGNDNNGNQIDRRTVTLNAGDTVSLSPYKAVGGNYTYSGINLQASVTGVRE